jgi:hypothetical protein
MQKLEKVAFSENPSLMKFLGLTRSEWQTGQYQTRVEESRELKLPQEFYLAGLSSKKAMRK